ncbi:NACHT and Ankyrin domain protein [Metarhizium anisopliae]|nr:NACHT and Ankyrin domain protein [Metarhizium anisopliae]
MREVIAQEELKKTSGDGSSVNLTPSEGVSPDESNASNKTLPPAAEPGLQILHDCEAPKIDIVAVHGLGANPDYAWVWLPKNNPPNRRGYPNKPFNWLRELLPAKISKPCRVLAFNYDSRWFRDAPQQKLSSISDTLLDSLRNDREQNKAIDRPLIFIGHSFGGNVIEQVVDEDSACIDGHHKISLHTDHLKINKYYGADDPSFKLIYPEIQRMVEDTDEGLNRRRNPKPIPTDETSTSGGLQRCLQRMRVKNPEDVLSKIEAQKGQRVENTCEWILKREEFSAWAVGTNSHLLRLIGSPGIGKTMMATFLVRFLKCKIEKNPSETFIHFFCDDKDQERKTPTAILRSLVWQLLLQRNELFEHVQPDFEKYEESRTFESLFNDVYALRRILKNMLLDERSDKVFVLIDALDECEASTRKDLLSWIQIISQLSPAGDSGKIKILLTCRPHINDIEDELQDVGTQLQMGSAEINHDLAKYIDDRVDELANRKHYPLSLKRKVIETLKRESGNTFLWVSLMIAELKTTFLHKVEEKLNRLPHGLNNTYSTILDRIPDENRENAQFILRFMVAALRPLKKTELQAAYATWKTNSRLSGEDMQLYSDILSVCSSILHAGSEDNATLNFCHQSVKDFLLDEHTANTWYHTSVDEANILIFKVCWMYLSADEFSQSGLDFCSLWSDLEIDFDEPDKPKDQRGVFSPYLFLEYSYDAWKEHAIRSHKALLRDWHNLAIDVTKAPELRDNLLFWTARQGYEDVVNFLLDQGANIESRHELGVTPLSTAAASGHEIIVELLLDRGANIEARNISGVTPLLIAAREGHESIVKLLLDRGANIKVINGCGDTPLLLATLFDSKSAVKLLLDNGADIEARDWVKDTPLLRASMKGSESIVKLLLDRGANTEVKNKIGHTPLSIAAVRGHIAVVKLLLDNGADIETRDDMHSTPLLLATEKNHVSTVKLLLERGADIKVKNKENQTLLSIAAAGGHEGIVKLLEQCLQ